MTMAADSITNSWLNATLVAAYLALLGTLLTIAVNGYIARKSRRRDQFAEALAVVVEYWEFPYVVRRRRHDEPAAERVRISEELRDVQRRLAFHQAWIRTESRHVASIYDELVVATRTIIGGQIRDAWAGSAITEDSEMNISNVSFDGLTEIQKRFLEVVVEELSLWPMWLRRKKRAGT